MALSLAVRDLLKSNRQGIVDVGDRRDGDAVGYRAVVARGDARGESPAVLASVSRRSIPETARTSPASPISPKATRSGASGRSMQALASAIVSARSEAGSRSWTPPTVAA